MTEDSGSNLWISPHNSTVFGLAALVDINQTHKMRIPSDDAEVPWDEFFGFFNELKLAGDFRPKNVIEARWIYVTCIRPWLLKIHWLYKKTVDQSHKIPASRSVAKSLECEADVLVCIREICKELHKEPEITEIYSNFSVWLSGIVLDQILLSVQLKLEEIRNQDVHKKALTAPKSKKRSIANVRSHWLSSLHAGESPFQHEDSAFCPHWANFIQLSLKKADPTATRTEKGNIFRQKYWKLSTCRVKKAHRMEHEY
jgi:hypothetical protein